MKRNRRAKRKQSNRSQAEKKSRKSFSSKGRPKFGGIRKASKAEVLSVIALLFSSPSAWGSGASMGY